MTITEFLEARISEDEAAARKCADQTWKIIDEGDSTRNPLWVTGLDIAAADSTWDACIAIADAEHATRHDPARVLAECAAKRAIIELHPVYIYTDDEPGFEMELSDHVCPIGIPTPVVGPCKTLRALAAVYADHPDYQQEWAV